MASKAMQTYSEARLHTVMHQKSPKPQTHLLVKSGAKFHSRRKSLLSSVLFAIDRVECPAIRPSARQSVRRRWMDHSITALFALSLFRCRLLRNSDGRSVASSADRVEKFNSFDFLLLTSSSLSRSAPLLLLFPSPFLLLFYQ